ncbi:phage tail tape measure protein [Acinetobacter qingfengensis]|uniref:Uncharacterized protein n=1 Tax=Acinetobacter qingfengensis TaxID=1262585 RepID=A0A1E7RCI2_9GAMM|nr:hypothetical protein [Acinetobacter qingfengensis]KAA8734905.1 phage tail tape measure protein [Acinetobacter qingfengensis]OEY96927.1 hypothetical protein BJI46_11635 [Acinetobacter qingfengensis]
MKPLKLEVIFGSKDNLSPALKMMVGSNNAAAKALKNTRDELKKLQDQQKQVDTFRKLKDDVKQATVELERNKKTVQSLREQLAINPDAKLTQELKKAENQIKQLTKVVTEGRPRLVTLRNELNETGLKSQNLAEHQQDLKNKITAANTSIDNQKTKLENLNRIQQNHQKYAGNVRTAAMYGAGATATGMAAMYQMRKPIEESKHVDIEEARIASLGLGQKSTDEAIKYAKAMKTFGTSTLDNLQLVRDGVTAFADVHHAQMVAPTLAKMKFANEAMYGNEQGAENEKKFMDMLKVIEMRNGLKSEKAFQEQANIIQQVITATGGRVQAGEWLNAIKTGGVAVKGLTNEALYYKMEPIVQELGGDRFGTSAMSAYQNIYQGRTTVRAARNMADFGLLDGDKVTYDKVGQVAHLNPGALKGGELFKQDQFAWMEQVLLPALAKKGITERGAIHDAIGSMFTNRNASNLFTTMYDQRDQIHKNSKLNAGADNIDQLNTKAVNTTAGKELEARAKLHDAYLQFGTMILPIYTQAMIMAANAMQGFTTWMQKNPTLAKAFGTGLLVIAAGLIAIGGLLVVFSPLILGILSLRLVMKTLGVEGGILTKIFGGFSTSSLALTTRFNSIISRVSILSNVLRAKLSSAWVTSNPKDFISRLRQLPNIIKAVIANSWAMTKAFGVQVYTSFINAARGAWLFATALTKNTIAALRNYTLAASNAIRVNGLLGTSKILLKNAALGLWSVLSGGAVGIFTTLATGIRLAAQSILFLGRALLMNPIGLAITAIAGAAFLIYKYWQPIKAFFTGFWQGFTEGIAPLSAAFSPLFQTIGSALTPLKPIWDWLIGAFKTAWQWVSKLFQPFQATKQQLDSATSSGKAFGLWLAGLVNIVAGLVGKFFNFGANIIQGLINGIMSGFDKLKSTWTKVTSFIPNFFTKKNEIRSPSRLFKRFGGYITEGLHLGLMSEFPQLKNQYSKIQDLFTAGINSPAMDKVKTAAPLVAKILPGQAVASKSRSGGITIEGDTITVQIHAAPGQPVNNLLKQFEQLLNQRDREKAARIRDSYLDQE